MALCYELRVYKHTYKLVLMIFEYTKDFIREYKVLDSRGRQNTGWRETQPE